MKILPAFLSFDWDAGNIGKNLSKHNVTDQEAEEVFASEPKFILEDEKHSLDERRFMLWGVTKQARNLTVIFTIRGSKIRIISARNMNKKEKETYVKKIQAHSQL
jgi:uncharacterized DUF497 family protein